VPTKLYQTSMDSRVARRWLLVSGPHPPVSLTAHQSPRARGDSAERGGVLLGGMLHHGDVLPAHDPHLRRPEVGDPSPDRALRAPGEGGIGWLGGLVGDQSFGARLSALLEPRRLLMKNAWDEGFKGNCEASMKLRSSGATSAMGLSIISRPQWGAFS
jgi:hypothetical protein